MAKELIFEKTGALYCNVGFQSRVCCEARFNELKRNVQLVSKELACKSAATTSAELRLIHTAFPPPDKSTQICIGS